MNADEAKYPAFVESKKTGAEPIEDQAGNCVGRVLDFWQWAHSSLMGNAERGALAEYIVACALGVQNAARVPWDRVDLFSRDGIAIEVKTAGYIQTWAQKRLSKLVFGIQPTYGWNAQLNKYDPEKKRQSDVYVFCVHGHKEQETADPLKLSQWKFYVINTKKLNEAIGNQKTIALSKLKSLGAKYCRFEELCKTIQDENEGL